MAVAVAVPQSANAQVVKPFKIVGVGIAPEGLGLPGEEARPNDIVGNATHLGRHTGDGSTEIVKGAFIDSTTLAGDVPQRRTFVFIGANGDKLVCDYGQDEDGKATGTYVLTVVDVVDAGLLVEAFFEAEIVPQANDSTGKFSGVTGSWTMFAQTEPFFLGSDDPFVYMWEGDGKLTFRRGGRKR